MTRKKIFIINGSASNKSSNEKLIANFARRTTEFFELTIFHDLKSLPHFDPELSADNPPHEIVDFRRQVQDSDGIVICTPEYVYSIPSGLKSAIEWCVSTTVFSGKPLGIITASAHGQKGHEELQLIMQTVMAKFNSETTMLIQGIKGKVNTEGEITDAETLEKIRNFTEAFKLLLPGFNGSDSA